MSANASKLTRFVLAAAIAASGAIATTAFTATAAHAVGTSAVGGQISRSEVLARAQSWVDEAVPYSQSAYKTDSNGTYRQDCSGLVSMAWHIDTTGTNMGFTTTSMGQYATQLGSLDDLQPGDAINNISSHTVLFSRWTDSGHTAAVIYEEAHTGTDARSRTMYRSEMTDGGFKPFRYNKVIDDVLASGQVVITGVGDINNNGVADLMVRRKSDGHALIYWGKGDGTYTNPTDAGGGWDAYDMITGIGDINNNGVADLMVRRKSDGHALIYWGKGDGTYTNPTDAGGGWDAYDAITGIGDINNNGVADLMVRRKSDGHALIYWGKGDGTYTNPTDAGGGWDAYDAITGIGDINNNGVADLMVRRKSDGHALIYWGKGDGTYTNPTDAGGGWDAYDAITGIGDINNNGVADLMVRRKSDGHALIYWGKGDGTYTNPTDAGGGWDIYA
ncbi:VCBS repeat protein [Streptomyces sp. TLI_235]|nr:VCBS repeat-containing protein [Streptomyces sp. TLI_235]PBC71180.1 VCBS repeat protein [Streptomyces sp. TLI_235]